MESSVLTAIFLLSLSWGFAMQEESFTSGPTTANVGRSQSNSSQTTQTTTVEADKATTLVENMSSTLGENMSSTLGENMSTTVGDNKTTTIETSSASSIITTMLPTDASKNGENLKKTCRSGRGDVGLCVSRQLCEYGTGAIDFSLYAPHDYVKTCLTTEVCCPELYIVKMKEQSNPDNNFTFDDDD